MFVEGDQRAQRGGVEVVAQDRRAGAVAGVIARGVLALLARHQRGALRKAVHQQDAVVRGVELVTRGDAGDEIDRDQMRALVEQLEHRVLRIGAHPAPGDRRGRAIDRLHVGSDALAVRFHFELLEVIGEQAEAFVIGEDRARLAPAHAGVVEIGEGRAQDEVGRAVGVAEMFVHRLGACEHGTEIVHPHRHRDRKADRGPDRIAPADAFLERQDARFVDAPFDRAFGIGGQRDHAPAGIGDAIVAQPFERAGGIGHRFDGGEGLAGHRDQRLGRVALGKGCLERDAVDVGDDMDIAITEVAAERVDPQRGAERAAADADVDEVLDLAQRALVDRLDQHAHAVDQRHRLLDLGALARAAQSRVVGGAAFGRIDDFTGEQLAAHADKVHRFGELLEARDHRAVEMRFRPVEQDPAFIERDPAREHGDAVGAARFVRAFAAVANGAEQFAQRRARERGKLVPDIGSRGHGAKILSCPQVRD